MKHRNIMVVIFLSLLTFGIYDLFWLVKTKKELNAKTSIQTPSILILFAPIGALFIAALVGALLGNNVSDPETQVNLVVALVYAVAFLVIIPVYFYWFFKFSKAVSEYTHGELNTAVNLLLLYVLRFVGIAVMQDKFNDMLAAGATPVVTPANMAGPAQPEQALVPQVPAATPTPTEPPAEQTASVAPTPGSEPTTPTEPTTPAGPTVPPVIQG